MAAAVQEFSASARADTGAAQSAPAAQRLVQLLALPSVAEAAEEVSDQLVRAHQVHVS